MFFPLRFCKKKHKQTSKLIFVYLKKEIFLNKEDKSRQVIVDIYTLEQLVVWSGHLSQKTPLLLEKKKKTSLSMRWTSW